MALANHKKLEMVIKSPSVVCGTYRILRFL